MWIIRTTKDSPEEWTYLNVKAARWGTVEYATKFRREVDARAYQREFGLQDVTEVRNILPVQTTLEES